jgi:TPR repeat protein
MKTNCIFTAAIRAAACVFFVTGLTRSVLALDTNVDVTALQKSAGAGHAEAEYKLAVCYQKGTGVPHDNAKAFALMRQSAEQGYAPAEGQLGYYYGIGLGVTNDPVQALNWYRKAADQGNAAAQFGMGNIYSTGRGVTRDMDQAIRWWRKAADQNYAKAQYTLGELYLYGDHGSPTNYVNYDEAAKWFRQAAGQGDPKAMNNLGMMYDYNYVKPNNWRGQTNWETANWKEAAKWYRQGAESGDATAQGNLGTLYLDGRGVTHDVVQAYAWFSLAAEKGNPTGKMYLREYDLNELLNSNQLAQAEQMVNTFHASHPISTNYEF